MLLHDQYKITAIKIPSISIAWLCQYLLLVQTHSQAGFKVMPVDTPYFVYYIFHSLCLDALAKALNKQCQSANTSLKKNLHSGLLGTTESCNTCAKLYSELHVQLLRETHEVRSVVMTEPRWWCKIRTCCTSSQTFAGNTCHQPLDHTASQTKTAACW